MSRQGAKKTDFPACPLDKLEPLYTGTKAFLDGLTLSVNKKF